MEMTLITMLHIYSKVLSFSCQKCDLKVIFMLYHPTFVLLLFGFYYTCCKKVIKWEAFISLIALCGISSGSSLFAEVPVSSLQRVKSDLGKKQKSNSSNPWLNFVSTLNASIATKVVCFSHLLKCFTSLYGKQGGLRSECSYRSSLLWVHAVCFYT